VNYKRKYKPDSPTVTIVDAVPGPIVTPAELERFNLLASREPRRDSASFPQTCSFRE